MSEFNNTNESIATGSENTEAVDTPVGDTSLPKDHPYYNIPINFNIVQPVYRNNEEYRDALKELCYLRYPDTFPKGDYPEDTEPESRHEMTYDLENMTYALDFIWHHTKSHPLFIQLYKTTAMEMFTDELEIGLALLFSYDYLMYFYPLFREYMVLDKQIEDTHPLYVLLKTKLEKK